MIGDKTVLAIIPARGGSKGVSRKNIRQLAGKPLIAWTIEDAKKSKYIDRLILTSEDSEIMKVAKEYNCDVPFIRPDELAQDETPGIDPILHAVEMLPGYDYVILLQPTSPLRNVIDIDSTIEKSFENDGRSVVTVTESEESPYWMYNVNEQDEMSPLLDIDDIPKRRQDAPKSYVLNGAVYVTSTEKLQHEKSFLQKDTIANIMPRERSLDIDTEIDFRLCEMVVDKILNYNLL